MPIMRKGEQNGSARKSSANYQRQKKVDVAMTSTFFIPIYYKMYFKGGVPPLKFILS